MLRQQRVVIDRVEPQINGGEYYIKRVVGQVVKVNADVLVDGHDVIAAPLQFLSKVLMHIRFRDGWITLLTGSMG